MKKEIEQESTYGKITVTDLDDPIEAHQMYELRHHFIHIEKSKAREVALAICPKLGDLYEENSALLSIHYSDEIRTKELEKELEKLRERNEELEKSKTDMHLDRIKMIQQILSLQSQINLMKK